MHPLNATVSPSSGSCMGWCPLTGQIDDGQPAVAEGDPVTGPHAAAVGTAGHHAVRHRPDGSKVRRAPSRDLTGDATHSCSTPYILRAYVTAMCVRRRPTARDGVARAACLTPITPSSNQTWHRPLTPGGVRPVGSADMVRLVAALAVCLAALLSSAFDARRGGRHGRAARRHGADSRGTGAGVDRRRHGHRPDPRGTRRVRHARAGQHHQDTAGAGRARRVAAGRHGRRQRGRHQGGVQLRRGEGRPRPTPRRNCSMACCWSRATTPPTPWPTCWAATTWPWPR